MIGNLSKDEIEFPIEYEPGIHEIELEQSSLKIGNISKLNALSDVHFVFICFTNRSGSNWLSELLGRHRSLNQAGEPYNFDQILRICKKENISSIVDYFIWQVENKKTADAYFVSKISWDQLYYLTKIGVIPPLAKQSRFIQINRMNILSQSVSYLKALQSAQWTSMHEVNDVELKYDGLKLIQTMKQIRLSRSMFDLYYSVFGVPKIIINYENLEKNTRMVLLRITDFIGLGDAVFNLKKETKIKIQRDGLSEEFIKKFKREFYFDLTE